MVLESNRTKTSPQIQYVSHCLLSYLLKYSRPLQETEKRLKHLEFVLNKSAIYAECLRDQMDKHKARQQTFVESSSPPPKAKPTTTRRKSTRGGGGRKRAADDLEEDEDVEEGESAPAAKKKRLNRPGEDAQPGEDPQSGSGSTEGVEEDGGVDSGGVVFQQPSLITGAKMKDYQLEGLQWMVALHQNGISGILGMLCLYSFCCSSC